MDEPSPPLALHRQRRKVELLRQQVYDQPDPNADPERFQTLLEAETYLLQLEQAHEAATSVEQAGILLDSTAPAAGGQLMGGETTGIEVKVQLRQARIPTAIVHLLDPLEAPLVTYKVAYRGEEFVRLRLTSFVEGYSAQAVDTVELTYQQPTGEINQLPTFFPAALQAVNERTRATLHIQVDDLDGAAEQHSTFPIWLQARTSACLGLHDPASGRWVDLTHYLAAWVTPNAPSVMKLLREAAGYHPDKMIIGYQGGREAVEAQVRAAFEALKALGIQYVNSVLAFGADRGELMQRIRCPREALENQSANCIDGAVLMASVLEAASLSPGLVLVPGHAFLAWETMEGSGEWDYLETTMIGSHPFEAAQATGRALAQKWSAQARQSKDARYFRLLPLAEIRANKGVTPME